MYNKPSIIATRVATITIQSGEGQLKRIPNFNDSDATDVRPQTMAAYAADE